MNADVVMNAWSSVVAVFASAAPPAGFNDSELVALTRFSTTTLGGIVVLLLLASILSWRSTRGAPRNLRVSLLMLRLVLASLLFVVVLEPGRRLLAVSREPNRVIAMVDTSSSMTLDDHGESPRIRRAIDALRAIRQELARADAPFVLDVRAFDGTARPLSLEDEDALYAFPKKVNGSETRLTAALEGLGASLDGHPLGGVVVISDGADSTGLDVSLNARTRALIADVGAPVHTVVIGTSESFKDIALTKVTADAFAFVRNKVKVLLSIRHPGFDGAVIPLTVKEDGATVFLKEITLKDGAESTFELEIEPKSAGTHIYTFSTTVHPDEAIAENNRVDFTLEVIRDRIRVLQVAGRPSWDERFVRRLLKENPSVDLISFFILRSPTDNPNAGTDELSLIPFPTRELFTEELHTFDVVILQDFNYRPYQMGLYLQNIKQFVEEAGGGLMMIGGSLSFSEGEYDGTPIADVLPVELLAGPGHLSEEAFKPIVTDAGRSHPITDLSDLGGGADPFSTLPELIGLNRVLGLKPGADALLVHPFLNAGDKAHPVVAVREVGAGRSLAIMTDTTWRWSLPNVGAGGRGDAHRRFLANSLRWLIRDPELSRVKLTMEKREVEPDAPVAFEVRSFDPRYRPEAGRRVHLKFEPLDENAPPSEVEITTGPDGIARTTFEPNVKGAWRVTATGLSEARTTGTDVDAFVVRAALLETLASAPRPEVLGSIAAQSGGRLVVPEDVASLKFKDHNITRVHRQQTEPLWTTLEVIVLIALIAGLEWWVRRRRGFM